MNYKNHLIILTEACGWRLMGKTVKITLVKVSCTFRANPAGTPN